MNLSASRATFRLLAVIALRGALACAQDYPNKPVRIVTVEPGGSPDLISRLIGQGIAPVLNQPVVIDNRVGFIGIEIVAKSPPDGYTLAVNGSSLWILPFLKRVAWDPVKDF